MYLVTAVELFDNVKEVWLQYYPVVVGGLVTVAGLLAGALVVWAQIKPLFDKLAALKDTVQSEAGKIDPMKIIQQNTLLIDLEEKLKSPAYSDEAKLKYQAQFYELQKVIDASNSALAKGEEVVDKTSGNLKEVNYVKII